MLSGSGRNKSIVAHDRGDEEGRLNDKMLLKKWNEARKWEKTFNVL